MHASPIAPSVCHWCDAPALVRFVESDAVRQYDDACGMHADAFLATYDDGARVYAYDEHGTATGSARVESVREVLAPGPIVMACGACGDDVDVTVDEYACDALAPCACGGAVDLAHARRHGDWSTGTLTVAALLVGRVA